MLHPFQGDQKETFCKIPMLCRRIHLQVVVQFVDLSLARFECLLNFLVLGMIFVLFVFSRQLEGIRLLDLSLITSA